MQTKSKYFSMLVLVLITFMAVLYVIFTLPQKQGQPLTEVSASHKVINIDSLAPSNQKQYMLDFKLTDQKGQIFEGTSLKGKPALVYFGFTFCPDICPTALNKVVEVMDTLKKYAIDLNAVFITIDPERDSPATLAKYMTHFNQDIIGLSGTPSEIKQVASLFNVYYAKDESGDAKNYMLNHSSFIYILDRDGMMVKLFSFQDDPKTIIDFLRLNFRK